MIRDFIKKMYNSTAIQGFLHGPQVAKLDNPRKVLPGNKIPHKFQWKGVELIEYFRGRAYLADDPGLGKGGTLSSKILTPYGWTTYGKIKVGDKVIGSNGKPCTVTGVFPKKTQQIYRVTFSDGFSVEVDGDHLWTVTTKNDRKRGTKRTISTKDMYEGRIITFKSEKRNYNYNASYKNGNDERNYAIPIVQPVHFAESIPTDVDPYLLGVYLGDGNFTANYPYLHLNSEDAESILEFAKIKNEVRIRTAEDRPNATIIGFKNKNLLTALEKYNLRGKKSWEKFVPKQFMKGSPKDRLRLVQGLMDTDGYPHPDGGAEYSSTSGRLKDAMVFLVQSLGGIARASLREEPIYTYKGEKKIGRPAWRINIKLPPEMNPFHIERKAKIYKIPTKYLPMRTIENIESCGRQKTVCISVDAKDKLYVTDHFIVTHNTFQSLIWHLWHPELRPAIIVCPNTVKYNWERECSSLGLRAEVVSGHRKMGRYTDCPLTIINYDVLSSWEDYLIAMRPKIITIDEIHLLANKNTQRFKNVKNIVEGADIPARIGLSGTPMPNNIAEIWTALNIIRPDLYPDFQKFAWRFSKPVRKARGWDFGEAVRVGILNANLTHKIMIRRRKEDVLKDLPKQTMSIVLLDLEDRKEYDRAVNDFEGWMKSTHPDKIVTDMNKLGHLLRLTTRLKTKAVIRWVEEFIEGNKLILFGIHNELFLDVLEKHFSGACVLVNGSVTDKKRDNAIDKFNNDKNCKLFLGQIKAVAEGWSCTCTSYTAHAEPYWNPAKHRQGMDRVHGIGRGQKGISGTAYWLAAVNTVEERLFKMIETKQATSDAAIDGKKGISGFNVYTLFLNEVKKGLSGK